MSKETEQHTRDHIKNRLSFVTGGRTISDEARLSLFMDSIEMMDFITDLEELFSIDLSWLDTEKLNELTVNQLVAIVETNNQ